VPHCRFRETGDRRDGARVGIGVSDLARQRRSHMSARCGSGVRACGAGIGARCRGVSAVSGVSCRVMSARVSLVSYRGASSATKGAIARPSAPVSARVPKGALEYFAGKGRHYIITLRPT
jgi:hypothetical protein